MGANADGRLAGKVVIVTGAARGMGRATAQACRAEGAELVISDRDPAVTAVADELAAQAVVGDVADPALAAQAVQAALEKHGAVHGLAHVAGAHLNGDITELTDDDWARMLAINLTGPMVWSRAAVPAITEAGGGSIVIVASINSWVAHPRSVGYSSAKAGAVGLMAEAGAHLVDEELGLLEGGEVPAAVELVPVAQVAEAPLDPALATGGRSRLGKTEQPTGTSTGPRDVDARRSSPSTAAPTTRRCRQPVEHHVVEQLVAGEDVLGVPSQSVHAQNFSTIHAHCAAGESTRP
jgi:NAD(P)-dependent dehydrogenase (short-subunit alcohol dehydrogenase family)